MITPTRFRLVDPATGVDATLAPAEIRDYLIATYADCHGVELDARNIAVRLQYNRVDVAQRLARLYLSPTITITAEETQ